ncbi:MAG: Fur family transcriptional regulator [Candidatus Riflemargulisbacteria bacterium]
MKATEILKSNGINITSQRVKVLDYLLTKKQHLTVDQIYASIADKNEIISLATVYNVISLFVEKGILKRISSPEDKAIFDVTLENHFHFYCTKCGSISDVSSSFFDISALDLMGNKPDLFFGYFTGTCNECNKGVKKGKLLNLLRQKVKIFNRR